MMNRLGWGALPAWARAVIRGLAFYLAITFVSSLVTGKSSLTKKFTPQTTAPPSARPPPGYKWPTACACSPGERLTLYAYITEIPVSSFFAKKADGDADDDDDSWFDPSNRSASELVWKETMISYDWASSNSRNTSFSVKISESLRANLTTLVCHFYAVRGNGNLPKKGRSMSQHTLVHPMIRYSPRPKRKESKNLMEDSKVTVPEVAEETKGEVPWVTYLRPTMEVRLLGEGDGMVPERTPEGMRERMHMNFSLGVYWPPFFVNTFWEKREGYLVVNESLTNASISMSFSPIGVMKYSLMAQMESQMRMQLALTGGVVEEEMDEFKRILTETNPVLLTVTAVVSTVHMVFEFLAFKNDVSFWRSRKSMAGISVKTVMLNCVCQAVVLLYLLDNETSWMIVISAGIGLLIELWKIGKAVRVRRTTLWGFLPWVRLEDRASYTRSNTKEFDDKAFKYLFWALLPLIALYSLYSLKYQTHKSWYSWVLGSLTGTVYTFGFVMMTPQLFINYKLKSVAHLPWRALVYKSLNTFIDDLFSFIIKMPTMHRLACFRDDVVFVIYIYQRWLYPVDRTRLESSSWEDAADALAEQKDGAPAAAPASAAAPPQSSTTTEVVSSSLKTKND